MRSAGSPEEINSPPTQKPPPPARHGEFAAETPSIGRRRKDTMPKYTLLNDTAGRHGFIVAYPNALGGSWGISPDKISADVALFDALVARIAASYRIDPDRIYLVGMSNGGVNAARKFPVMIVHGTRDSIFAIGIARENRDKYQREGHEVKYVEVPGLGHAWASDVGINEQIWSFFASHPLR